MTVRRYLESVGEMEDRLSRLLRQKQVLGALALSEGEDRALRQDQGRAAAGAIEAAWQKLHRQRRLLDHSIGRLPREEERTLLTLRYLKRLSYSEIAEILDYSERQVYRIHHRAVMHMQALVEGGYGGEQAGDGGTNGRRNEGTKGRRDDEKAGTFF